MTQVILNGNGILSLGAISKEEDLNPKARIIINGPPSDGRCQVCGRHMSELTPFGGPGDPLVGDFSGELLVKTFRPDGPYDAEAEEAWERALKVTNDKDDPLPWFIGTYGEDKGKRLYWAGQLHGSIGKSWECRDCIVLHGDEYFQKREQTWEKEKLQDLKRFDELAKEKGLTEKDKQLFDKSIEDKAVDGKIPVYIVKRWAVNDFEDFWKGWEIYKQREQKKR